MRTTFGMIAAFALTALVACEKFCEINPELCAPPPQEEVVEPTPPSAPPTESPPPPAPVPFTWHRDGEVLPELTAVVSLEGICVDAGGDFVFSLDTHDYSVADGVEVIDLTIVYAVYPEAEECYILLRQNEQETPDAQAPTPGRGTYQIDDVEYVAQIVEAGPFAGYWAVPLRQLHPDVE